MWPTKASCFFPIPPIRCALMHPPPPKHPVKSILIGRVYDDLLGIMFKAVTDYRIHSIYMYIHSFLFFCDVYIQLN